MIDTSILNNALDIIMHAFSQDGAMPQATRDAHGTYVVAIDEMHRVHVAASHAGRIELFAEVLPGTCSDVIGAPVALEWFSSDICDPPFDWRLGIQAGTGMALLCASAHAAALDSVTFAAGMKTFIGRLRQYASASDGESFY